MSRDYDLSALADVYLTTFAKRGNASVLWRMAIGDAQQVCDDPTTAGRANYGGQWMLCWTAHALVDPVWDAFIADDGRFLPLFERLGVTLVMSRQMLLDGTAVIPMPEPTRFQPVMRHGSMQLDLFGGMP